MPGPRLGERPALVGFVISVLAYQFCQQAEVLLFLPRPLAYGMLAWCVGGAAWLWVAARALFDDHFRWSGLVLALLGTATLIGLSANLPYFPQRDGPAIKRERWADQILPNAALERSTIACKRALPDGIEVDRHWVQVRPAAGLDDLARNVVPDQCRQPSISRVRPTPVS